MCTRRSLIWVYTVVEMAFKTSQQMSRQTTFVVIDALRVSILASANSAHGSLR